MNKELIHLISIGAFLHDIGKFAERGQAVDKSDPDLIGQEYRYTHAYHTEQALKALFFSEQLQKSIDNNPELNILNLAARHHKPRNIYEEIISHADRIAAGHERISGDTCSQFETGGRERKRQTPLMSILSRIQIKNIPGSLQEDFWYRIGLASQASSTSRYRAFFPVAKNQYTYDKVEKDYKIHWQKFSIAIKPSSDKYLDLFNHFPTIIALCQEFQWCLPASTTKQELPDVSLYDHQKITAALASCLYCYHAERDTLNRKDLSNSARKKFILYCGDISGIQKFIYQISSKGAYKTLKGKSFFIQLLAEILSREFTEHFFLTDTNILYANGGKFYLLLPNLPEINRKLHDLTNSINKELLHKFDGEIYLRTGYQKLSTSDLVAERGQTLYQIWDELTRKLVFHDRQRYSELATENYDNLFGVHCEELQISCEVCHRAIKNKSHQVCSVCEDMKELGRQLGSAAYIALTEKSNVFNSILRPFKIRGKYVWLLPDTPKSIAGNNVLLLAINSADYFHLHEKFPGKVLNSIPFVLGTSHHFDVTFDEIAKRSNGNFKRLAILRMDIDNLGKIFSEGLEHYRHESLQNTTRFHSLGRITTLSWQLSQFFGAVIPSMIDNNPKWNKRVTVVYSGGDDLFLLGAWDVIPEIALEIQEQFTAFSCNNDSFSLSGGMVIATGGFPIYKSAVMAGEAEAAAKANETLFGRRKEPVAKNSFTFFDTPMHWLEFKIINEIQQELLTLINCKENFPLLRRLQDIAITWQENKNLVQATYKQMSLQSIHDHIMSEKWQWRMVYNLSRFAENKDHKIKYDIDKLQKFIVSNIADTNRIGIELLGVLSRWCELTIR